MTGANNQVQTKRKTKVGRVVSDKMDKTIVVSVERLARHPLYKRVIRLTTKFKAHDELNDAHTGDTVMIEESRPLSATTMARRRRSPEMQPDQMTRRPMPPKPRKSPTRPKVVLRDPATVPTARRRQHRRAVDPVHPGHGPLAQDLGRRG